MTPAVAASLPPLPPLELGYEAREDAFVDAAGKILVAGKPLTLRKGPGIARMMLERRPDGTYDVTATDIAAGASKSATRNIPKDRAGWLVRKAIREATIILPPDDLRATGTDPDRLATELIPKE